MSYLPRVERNYEDFYPNLDTDADIEVNFVTEADAVPEDRLKRASRNASPNASINAIRARSATRESTQTNSTSKEEVNSDEIIPVPKPEYAQFNVAGLIGGVNVGPRFLPSKHAVDVPKPIVRNEKVLNANLGYCPPGKTWSSEGHVRPDASMDVYKPFTTMSPQDPLDLEQQITEMTRVEYDIDEADLGVSGFSSMRFGQLMEPEVFEVIMSMLDLAAALICSKMFPMERQAALQKSSSAATATNFNSHVDMTSTDAENGNQDGDGSPNADADALLALEENRKCAVCNWAECTDSNTIVFCDGCDVAVHQDCYGVHSIPEGRWSCRRCESEGIGAEVDCVLCPRKYGAFKKTSENKWIHLVCALWTPIVHVPEDSSLLEPIVDAEFVERDRWTLHCYVCKQKEGACIQCAARDCYQAFHPTCAQAAGFFMTNFNHDIGDILQHQEYLPVYCHRHSVAHAPRGYPSPDLESARKLLAEEQAKQNAPGVSSFEARHHKYWRTPNGTSILPQAVVSAVIGSAKTRLGLDLDRKVVEFSCRYWTIKKDSLDGVMFGRRSHQALEIAQHRVIRAEQSEEPAKTPLELIEIVDESSAVLQPDKTTKTNTESQASPTSPKGQLASVRSRRAEAATRPPRKSRKTT